MKRALWLAAFATLVTLAVGAAHGAVGPDSGANGGLLQPDGKMLVAGWGARGGSRAFGLARYEPDGSPDMSFGLRGKVATAQPNSDFHGFSFAVARAVALQPDGRIVVAGCCPFALSRYKARGVLDRSFGTGGRVSTKFGSLRVRAYALAIRPNGKIVAAGASWGDTEAGFALARYRADGKPDNSFGADGRVRTMIGSGGSAYALAIQPDGRVVVAGSGGGGFALARYEPNGSLDSSFDADGVVVSNFGWPAEAHALALQPDGKILAAGFGLTSGTVTDKRREFVLARYDADGSLDGSFGSGGFVTTPFLDCGCDLPYGGVANAISLQQGGKIVAAGADLDPRPQSRGTFALARYKSDGSPDDSFGSDGRVTTSFGFNPPANGTSGDAANAVAVQPDGKVVAAGYSQFGPHTEQYEVALARYDDDGALDPSFGTQGKATTSIAFCLVPKVKRQILGPARDAIRNARCTVGRVKRVYSRNVGNKHVVSQKPRAGAFRLEGAKVKLTVSKGRRK